MTIMKKLSGQPKKILFIGIIFVIAAFICTIGILYFLVNTQKAKSEELGVLREQVVSLNAERDMMERLTTALEQEAGGSLDLGRLLEEADKVYDDTEKERREGHLWIDRSAGTCVVTLGALNGLVPGSRLSIYEGDKKIGVVVVKTLLDVISYVQPVGKPLVQFKNDYYRVVFEE